MSKDKLLPKLRFKKFVETGAWQKYLLEELVEVNNGKDYKHLGKGEIPVYGTGGYMTKVNAALSYEKDAIGIGRKGTIDKPYILKAPYWTVDTLFYAIPKFDSNINFFQGIFKNINWLSKQESTGVPSLSKSTINNIEILIPTIQEQQQIGTFLKKIDEMIQLQQSKVNKVKNIKSAYLSEMFPKEGEKYPKRRFEGFTEPLEEYKLKDMGRSLTGLSGKSKKDFGHGEAEFVTYMNVFNNPIAKSTQTAQVEVDDNQTEVEYGDIFFTVSSETPNEVGMSSVWLYDRPNVYLNSFCFGFRPTINLDPYYMAYMLRSPEIRKKFILLAQGISRYNISKTKAMELLFPIPSNEEQEKIGQFFKNLDNQISIDEEKLAKLEKLKQGYLNDMFV